MPGKITLVLHNSLPAGIGKPFGSSPKVGHISRTGIADGQSHQEPLSAKVATPPIEITIQIKMSANIPNRALKNK